MHCNKEHDAKRRAQCCTERTGLENQSATLVTVAIFGRNANDFGDPLNWLRRKRLRR